MPGVPAGASWELEGRQDRETRQMSPEDPLRGPSTPWGLGASISTVGCGQMKRKEGQRNLEESPLGPPTLEASGTGASGGRALSPGPVHSRAMQMGEALQRGGWHLMPALMAL